MLVHSTLSAQAICAIFLVPCVCNVGCKTSDTHSGLSCALEFVVSGLATVKFRDRKIAVF
jgi:hypothetical protein